MARYIQEYKIPVSGGTVTVPTCARFIGVSKVLNYFVLVAEIWGNPTLTYEIDVKVFRKDEYIHSDASYIGYTMVGTDLYHFCFTHGEVLEDIGDGGMPKEGAEKPKAGTTATVPVKHAGGMREI